MRTTIQRFLPVALTVAFISACADAPTSTVKNLPAPPSLHQGVIATPGFEQVILCKAGPVGTYTFDATASHPVLRNESAAGLHDLTAATYTINVTAGSTINIGGNQVPGACYSFGTNLHNHIALASGGVNATVTVVEAGIPAGIDFDHVLKYQNDAGTITSSTSTTNSATVQVGGVTVASLGASITFFNVPEPPPSGCTYTKGWYQNKNGAPTVIAVDGRTIAEAQAIFAATPGQPGGVTWGVGALTNNKPNNLLNLYQQFLAALQNLGGDANEDNGPPAVDAAIDAVQAATGGSGLYISMVAGTDVGALTGVLASFNEGAFADWPHCGWLN